MYNADRRSNEFIEGLHYFLSVAEANNNKDYSSPRILNSHIFANGFMEKYVSAFSGMSAIRYKAYALGQIKLPVNL